MLALAVKRKENCIEWIYSNVVFYTDSVTIVLTLQTSIIAQCIDYHLEDVKNIL